MDAQFIKIHGYLGMRTAFKLCSIPLSCVKTPRVHSDNAVLPGFYIVFIYSIKLKGELIGNPFAKDTFEFFVHNTDVSIS